MVTLTPRFANRPETRRRRAPAAHADPFDALQEQMNALMGDVWRGTPLANRDLFGGFEGIVTPSLDVREDESSVKVSAELPGLTQDDINLELADGVLTISGEKKHSDEQKDEQGNVRYSERAYGTFERAVNVGTDIDENNVNAQFKDGVLTVTLPKTEKAKERGRQIPISG